MTPNLDQPIAKYLLDVTTGQPLLLPVLADGTVLWSTPVPVLEHRPPQGQRLIGVTSQLGLEHAQEWLDTHPEWIHAIEQPTARLADLTIDEP